MNVRGHKKGYKKGLETTKNKNEEKGFIYTIHAQPP